jgi:hypothetical protein
MVKHTNARLDLRGGQTGTSIHDGCRFAGFDLGRGVLTGGRQANQGRALMTWISLGFDCPKSEQGVDDDLQEPPNDTLLLEQVRAEPVDFGGLAQEGIMFRPIIFGLVLAFLVSPAVAGPCSQRIADLEKSVTATQEGSGPALTTPSTTGSTSQPATSAQNNPATSPSQTSGANQAMQMLQQAKQLDQQGKEAECMQVTTQVSSMVPQHAK